jgi:hypothetical protein
MSRFNEQYYYITFCYPGRAKRMKDTLDPTSGITCINMYIYIYTYVYKKKIIATKNYDNNGNDDKKYGIDDDKT